MRSIGGAPLRFIRLFCVSVVTAALTFTSTHWAGAAENSVMAWPEWRAEVLPEKPGSALSRVRWLSSRPEIQVEETSSGWSAFVELEGVLDGEDWSLLLGETILVGETVLVKREGGRSFSFRAPLTAAHTPMVLTAVSPKGTVYKGAYLLHAPDFENRMKDVREGRRPEVPKRYQIFTGLSFTAIRYTQTGVEPYLAGTLTAKASATYFLLPRSLDVGATVFMAGLPLARSDSEIMARFLGINLRAGYALPWFKAPWRVVLSGGVYYTTMFVSPSRFGFRNMSGPQLFPVLRYQLARGHSAFGYLKYSPVAQAFDISFSNREFAFGGGYTVPLARDLGLTFTFDYSTIDLMIQDVNINAQTVSLGAGLSF